MSTLKSALLVLIFSLFSLSFTSSATNGPCTVQNDCQCIFASGATVDLSKYQSSQFVLNVPNDGHKVVFSPCEDILVLNPLFSNESNGCQGKVSVCIVNNTSFIDGGRFKEMKFSSTLQEEPVNIEFSKSGWTTKVVVNCNADAGVTLNDTVSVTAFDPAKKNVTLTLKSNNVCIGFKSSSGYGFFSTLFMVALIGFTIYFVGGALLLKFLRGAEGLEMIPNYEFWRNFPQSLKTLWSSCINKFETATPYENI